MADPKFQAGLEDEISSPCKSPRQPSVIVLEFNLNEAGLRGWVEISSDVIAVSSFVCDTKACMEQLQPVTDDVCSDLS